MGLNYNVFDGRNISCFFKYALEPLQMQSFYSDSNIPFMKARYSEEPVRPRIYEQDDYDVMANENESDADDEHMDNIRNDMGGEVCERIALDREEDVIKSIKDPKLPSKEEV